MCFHGLIEIPGATQYSHRVRQTLQEMARNDTRLLVGEGHFSNYEEILQECRFVLCPLGFAVWSARMVDTILQGSIPVIIADGIEPPFRRFLDWRKFSCKLMEAAVLNKTNFVDSFQELAANAPRYQAKIEAVKEVAPLFSYFHYAPHMIVLELWWRNYSSRGAIKLPLFPIISRENYL